MKGGEKLNISALQSLVIGNPTTVKLGNEQSSSSTKSFGSVFGQMMATPKDSSGSQLSGNIDVHYLKDVLQANTLEDLKEALRAIPGFDSTELTETINSLTSASSVEEILATLMVEPEQFLDDLKKLFVEAGLPEEEFNHQLEMVDVWTMIGFLEEVGVAFYEKLGETMDKNLTPNEKVSVVSFLKMVDFLAANSDMTVTMEQKLSSFTTMYQLTLEQLQTRLQTTPISKQGYLQLLQDKVNVQIVRSNESSSTDNGSSSKQPDTTSQGNVSSTTHASIKTEFSLSQEPNTSNRSETLMREMQLLLKRSNFGQVGGSTRMLIKLYPEHLGQIRIELHEANGVLSARILASTSLAKGMLDSQLHQLRHAFAQQNLQVDRIDISQSIQDPSRSDREQSFNEQFRQRQQPSEQQQNNNSEDETSFEEYLIELEV